MSAGGGPSSGSLAERSSPEEHDLAAVVLQRSVDVSDQPDRALVVCIVHGACGRHALEGIVAPVHEF
jgi:hypothetical protein